MWKVVFVNKNYKKAKKKLSNIFFNFFLIKFYAFSVFKPESNNQN